MLLNNLKKNLSTEIIYDARLISELLIELAGKGSGEAGELSPLKLQKILYFCQGFSLTMLERPLFYNKIEAWQYGPVIPDVYYYFKNKGEKNLAQNHSITDNTVKNKIDKEVVEVIEWVWNGLKEIKAGDLVTMTHLQEPWLKAYRNKNIEIPLSEIALFFTDKYKKK